MIGRLQAPIVLAHGLFGFSRIGIGPLTLTSYFRGIPQALRDAGNRVSGHARAPDRVDRLPRPAARLSHPDKLPDEPVHVIGHSMGGSTPAGCSPSPAGAKRILSLMTIGSPHQGTIIADFAKLKVGRIFRLLSAPGIDHRGCLDVTRRAARHFHRMYPQPDDLPCFSLAGEPTAEDVAWPLHRLFEALQEMEGFERRAGSRRIGPRLRRAAAVVAARPPAPDELADAGRDAGSEHSVPALYGRIVDNLVALGFGAASDRPLSEHRAVTSTGPVG